MQIFTIVKSVIGEGKDLKTEYQIAGNVSLVQAQQMLTEVTIASAKAEARKQAETETTVTKKQD